MNIKQPFHFEEFCNLDNSLHSEFLINSMDVMYSLESVQDIKNKALNLMNLKAGDTVLEAGCGHGQDSENIARRVGISGSVTAIDTSRKMLNEASSRSKHQNVRYLLMSADNIEFDDCTFTACYADRLFVSHKNYLDMLDELIRVTKPGGVICITDIDALSIIISPYNDSTKAVLEQMHQSFVNPCMGRTLWELFSLKGLLDIKVIPQVSMIRSFNTLSKIFQFSVILNEAIKSGKLSKYEADYWEHEMRTADSENRFLYTVTMFTVVGVK